MKSLLLVGTLLLASSASDRIEIPAGTAVVGADSADIKKELAGTPARPQWYKNESPKRKVEVESFFIDRLEVTNLRYKSLVPDHTFPPNLVDRPVVNITFADAEKFCQAAGGRLPTEAEWERAARGDQGYVYPWGDKFDGDLAIYSGSSGGGSQNLKIGSYDLQQSSSSILGGTHKAGSVSEGASPFGLLDMAGNVWEWVSGYYNEKEGLHILKGGSWLTPQASLRSSTRLTDPGLKHYNDFGFRCAYEAAR